MWQVTKKLWFNSWFRTLGTFLLLEAQQLQRSFGLLNKFLPFDPVSDAVLPIFID
jgi:hypothetical protein